MTREQHLRFVEVIARGDKAKATMMAMSHMVKALNCEECARTAFTTYLREDYLVDMDYHLARAAAYEEVASCL